MSTPQYANVPGAYADVSSASFIAATGTTLQLVRDVSAANSGLNLTGGCRLIDVVATSTDSVANQALIWDGVQVSLYANMGTVTTTATTNATWVRTTGSWITDGIKIGQTLLCQGAVTNGMNGVPGIVTAVTTTTITFSGVPTGFVAETEGAGFRVFIMTRRAPVVIPANAGNMTSVSAGTANVQIIGQPNDTTRDVLGMELGANTALFAGLYQAVSALPATIQISARGALR